MIESTDKYNKIICNNNNTGIDFKLNNNANSDLNIYKNGSATQI